MRFENMTVILAGQPSPLLADMGQAFLAEGARVFVIGPAPGPAERIAGADQVDADLADADSVIAAVRRVRAAAGQVDILVTNTLLPMPADAFRPAQHTSPALWSQDQQRFLNSVYYVDHAVGVTMLERGQGVIVNLVPVHGLFAQKHMASYTAAAGGVVMLTKALAVEWAASGLRVNAIACGIPPSRQDDPIPEAVYLSRIPVGRRAEFREFTEAVLFAAGDEATFVTGEVIRVDGGWTAYHLFFPFENAF